ncbi:MAG: hypothetical protein QOJ39_1716 [Candidatus Eremiobacteraeota bacterium]|jgi:hypothetical protein|nr:hypothetical protein [Candidatus Eremiobacteraeota bacterium]
MAERVFGPHVTGYTVLGIHIGATTEVFSDTSGGKNVPQSLSVVLSPPLGASSTVGSVANGASTTVQASPGISVTGTVENCRTTGGGSSPELFMFQFTLRAEGSVRVGPFHIPVSAQVDAFDVSVPTDPAVHAQLLQAPTAPPA